MVPSLSSLQSPSSLPHLAAHFTPLLLLHFSSFLPPSTSPFSTGLKFTHWNPLCSSFALLSSSPFVLSSKLTSSFFSYLHFSCICYFPWYSTFPPTFFSSFVSTSLQFPSSLLTSHHIYSFFSNFTFLPSSHRPYSLLLSLFLTPFSSLASTSLQIPSPLPHLSAHIFPLFLLRFFHRPHCLFFNVFPAPFSSLDSTFPLPSSFNTRGLLLIILPYIHVHVITCENATLPLRNSWACTYMQLIMNK